MAWLPFLKSKKIKKSFLGIDIGTTSIRVVELTRMGNNFKLENYGEVITSSIPQASFRTGEGTSLTLSDEEVARVIRTILREAEIQTKEVNFSIPDFSSFFTSFEVPSMTKEELSRVIKYEARAYVPLPISEVALDYSTIREEPAAELKKQIKVLVTAIPNEVVGQYRQIASLARLDLKALEAEAFALGRAVAKKEAKAVCVIDVGARSTTINILDKGNLKVSHSFNVSGSELTEVLSRSLSIEYNQAEELKKNSGIIFSPESSQDTKDILLPIINAVILETRRVIENYYQIEVQRTEKIILAGGSARLPGLKDYFSAELKQAVEIANPFIGISYPPVLEEILKEMGPSYAIAVGLALRGLE